MKQSGRRDTPIMIPPLVVPVHGRDRYRLDPDQGGLAQLNRFSVESLGEPDEFGIIGEVDDVDVEAPSTGTVREIHYLSGHVS